jgi:D-alanyl-D-alanine carboxypeptidase
MTIRHKVCSAFLLVLVNFLPLGPPFVTAQTRPPDGDPLPRIMQRAQAKLDQMRQTWGFPGATVGFVLPDGRSGTVSTGLADLATKRPLKTDDLILAGSIGKTFVAAEALTLVHEGVLDLDGKISRWVGAAPWFARLPNANDLTLRMLLNHSSGIPNHVEYDNFLKAAMKNAGTPIQYEDLLSYVAAKKPLFAAGKGYYYADTNYIVAALVIEKATGKTLYDEIERRFLKPLNLDHTVPSTDGSLLTTVNGYYQNKPLIAHGKFMINPQWEWAGGGFASTSLDLARWGHVLYSGKVLDSDSLALMLNSTSTGDGTKYGLGVELEQTKLGKAVGHDGEWPGFLSDMKYFPDFKFAVATQVNADDVPGANKFASVALEDFAVLIVQELFGDHLSAAERTQFQQLVEEWLKLIDAGKFEQSWDRIAPELQTRYARAEWKNALQPFQQQAGKYRSRKLKSIFSANPELISVDWDSSFTKMAAVTETVLLRRSGDGGWVIASYTLH